MPAYMGEISVNVSTFSFLQHRDIAPLSDELNEHVMKVETKRYNIGPPAAGEATIIVVLLFIGGATAGGFFQELGKDIYHGLREQFLHLYDKARQWDRPMPSIPMTIVVGRVRFNFTGELSRDKFRLRVSSANECLRKLPESYLNESEGASMNLFWNDESQSWEESPLMGLGAGDVDI